MAPKMLGAENFGRAVERPGVPRDAQTSNFMTLIWLIYEKFRGKDTCNDK
jgi:hypothetical protein